MTEKSLDALIEQVNKLVSLLDLHGRVSGLEVHVEKIEERLDKFEEGQKEIVAKLDGLQLSVTRILAWGCALMLVIQVGIQYAFR